MLDDEDDIGKLGRCQVVLFLEELGCFTDGQLTDEVGNKALEVVPEGAGHFLRNPFQRIDLADVAVKIDRCQFEALA